MASFQTDAFRGVKPAYLPCDAEIAGSPVDIDWSYAGAGVAANDIVTLIELPPGVIATDYSFQCDDIDTNASPTVAFSFGELNAAGTDLSVVYASGITIGQTGGLYRAANNAHLASDKTTTRRLGLKATAAAATAALTGKKGLVVLDLRG